MNANQQKLIVFIPGNPSIPEVYSLFLKSLNTPVVELPQIGQGSDFNAPKPLLNLQSNFEWHAEKIKELVQENQDSEVILMGHSLGCSSILFHYHELKEYIHKYILICPFLSPYKGNQWFIKAMGNQGVHRASKTVFRQFLKSKQFTTKLLNKALGDSPQMATILTHLRNPVYFDNFIHLLSSYKGFYQQFELLGRIQDIPEKKLHLLFGKNDYWVPDEKRARMAYASKHTILDMSHNFCLIPEEIKTLSNHLKTIV